MFCAKSRAENKHIKAARNQRSEGTVQITLVTLRDHPDRVRRRSQITWTCYLGGIPSAAALMRA